MFKYPSRAKQSSKKTQKYKQANLLHRNRLSQVTWEINIQTLSNGKPVGHQLERDDVEKTLEAIDGLWDFDFLGLAGFEFFVVGVADDDWFARTSDDCRFWC